MANAIRQHVTASTRRTAGRFCRRYRLPRRTFFTLPREENFTVAVLLRREKLAARRGISAAKRQAATIAEVRLNSSFAR
jgi:hypothetical protein